jgi:hypothetical protein
MTASADDQRRSRGEDIKYISAEAKGIYAGSAEAAQPLRYSFEWSHETAIVGIISVSGPDVVSGGVVYSRLGRSGSSQSFRLVTTEAGTRGSRIVVGEGSCGQE